MQKDATTPMTTNVKLQLNSGTDAIDATAYQKLVGCLQYLFSTRLNIARAINKLSQYMMLPLKAIGLVLNVCFVIQKRLFIMIYF